MRCTRSPSLPCASTTCPAFNSRTATGATNTRSCGRIFGRMLSPSAVKRTASPLLNSSRHTASNCAVFFRTILLAVDLSPRMADNLHGALLRHKAENVTRQLGSEFLDELQREVQRLRAMSRHKAARKYFRRRGGARHGHQLIASPLLQHVDVRQQRATGRGDARIPVPWRAVHPHLLATAPQNDAVV